MIPVIDTLKSMGNFPVVKASDVEINSDTRLDTELDKLSEISEIFTKVEE